MAEWSFYPSSKNPGSNPIMCKFQEMQIMLSFVGKGLIVVIELDDPNTNVCRVLSKQAFKLLQNDI